MLALLQPEEVSDRQLPLSVYVPFVQGFNGVYIFFQAVVESKAFLVPWTRSDREMELAQSVSQWKRCVGVAGGEGGGYFVFQVKWKQMKVDFLGDGSSCSLLRENSGTVPRKGRTKAERIIVSLTSETLVLEIIGGAFHGTHSALSNGR